MIVNAVRIGFMEGDGPYYTPLTPESENPLAR
jgi:hypothetical protein